MTQKLAELAAPFPAALIEFKPQATQEPREGDMGKAMGVCYVDPRHYYARLNAVCGMGWSDEYIVLPGQHLTILCRLTVDGVTRTGDGDAATGEENALTIASAQAFKRACAKFGLGAELYEAPKTWAEAKFGPAKGNGKRACYGFTEAGLGDLRRAYVRWAGGDAATPARQAAVRQAQPPAKPKPAALPPADGPAWEDASVAGPADGQVADVLTAIAGARSVAELDKLGREIASKLAPAQQLLVKGQYKEALGALRRAEAVEMTP